MPSESKAYLAMHVGDSLVIAPTEVSRMLQERIGKLFPIDGLLEDSFEYVGVNADGVSITQASFADGRLFAVDVPRGQRGSDPATEEQAIENRSPHRGPELVEQPKPPRPTVWSRLCRSNSSARR